MRKTTHLVDLKQDPHNARRHNERNRKVIEHSLQTDGFGRSVLMASDGTLIAGNATVEAAKAVGMDDVVIVPSDGTKIIAIQRTDIAPGSDEFHRLSLADNRAAELATWDPEFLGAIADRMDIGWAFSADELAAVIALQPDADDELPASEEQDAATGDDLTEEQGSLLKLIDVTIAEPKHQVHTGEVWSIGKHLLVVGTVMDGWSAWVKFLTGPNWLLCPYPGPFAPLTVKAADHRLLMVQPSVYIAGHIVDRWVDVHGDAEVIRQ